MDGYPWTGERTDSPSLIRPVWADPGYFLALYNVTVTDYLLDGVDTLLVAPARPDRWAVGFTVPSNAAFNLWVSPWGDPANVGFGKLGGTGTLFYKLFDYGPIVSFDWFAYSSLPGTVRVTEIYNRL